MNISGSQLRPITQRAANEIVYDQVHAAISSGQFAPGQKLSTRKIAEELNVSQMPVREAFHRLVADGGLVRHGNRSMSIPVLSMVEFSDVTDVRIMLEGQAAAKAAQNVIPKNQLRKLLQINEQLDDAVAADDRIVHLTLNRNLHFGVYRQSNSETLVNMIAQLWLRVGPLLRLNTTHKNSVLRSNYWHTTLVEALSVGDSEKARHAVEMDLKEAAVVVQKNWVAIGLED